MAGKEMTIPEIEREMGIKASALHHWIKNGLLARKVGRDYFIDIEVLQKFMEERVEKDTMWKLKPQKAPEQLNNHQG